MRRRPERLIGVAIGLWILLGCSGPVMAGERIVCPVCSKANDEAATYASKAGSTLVRGTANTLLGWTELIRQPVMEVKEGGNVFRGMAQGVGQGVKRTLTGAAEVLTFWTPKMNRGYLHFADTCPICMGKQ